MKQKISSHDAALPRSAQGLSLDALAAAITLAASRQTYYTIRFLVDRDRVMDAYRSYAYFRWVDDAVDDGSGSRANRCAFLDRQKSLLETCYWGRPPSDVTSEEAMLVELVQHDPAPNSGLQIYLRNMMQVMDFDVRRRGRLVSQAELDEYTCWLATAVTEAMHYFIGHDCSSPHDETRYLAVAGAHITHMLRDTLDDLQAGYYNIPREVLEAGHIGPQDVRSRAHRAWVRSRVDLARQNFRLGREYLARVEEPRCRLAGIAYMARFEWLLDTIEAEDYWLRTKYAEQRRIANGLRMGLLTLSSLLNLGDVKTPSEPAVSHAWRRLWDRDPFS